MQLEDCFDFQAPNDIRIKGSRIGIESVLYEYIHNAKTPEEIDAQFWSIDLEQVYATILYYLHNKEAVHQYVADWLEYGERMRREQEANPPPVIQRLRKLRQQYGDNIDLLIAERRAQYQIAEHPVVRTPSIHPGDQQPRLDADALSRAFVRRSPCAWHLHPKQAAVDERHYSRPCHDLGRF